MVYRAFDGWTDRVVAIKVLNSEAARQPQMAKRMVREQAALSALKGTAAVELLDVCRSASGELCLVMELLSGVDLDDHLFTLEQRNERLSLYRVAEIFDPIVDTLKTAHEAGILHRDLKPANIFLLDGGAVRLLDFGMARLRNSAPLTAAGTVMGSPSFMAPEAWMGQPELVDHRADVYSLAVILFRVLSGELPFSGDSLQQKFFGATTGTRPRLQPLRPDLPREIDEWVAQALAINREQRFGNVTALWNAFLETLRLTPPGRAGRGRSLWGAAREAVRQWTRSHRPPAPPLPETTDEPSYAREALARSVPRASVPGDPAPETERMPHSAGQQAGVETTLVIEDHELLDPPSPPPPPRRAAPVEKTLELSGSDLVLGEDTVPLALARLHGQRSRHRLARRRAQIRRQRRQRQTMRQLRRRT